ncbi:MAG: type II toxin-antitoxin system VapC family toxin [Cellvibrionales bacterium]|nr:type II toxin-antitoxin system VapC family toxin [Cellvibrionales bacterium]
MYLLDTNVISELRKKNKATPSVRAFMNKVIKDQDEVFLSVITVGELRRGVEKIQHRGDNAQAEKLASWIDSVIVDFSENILPFGIDEAQVWGKLRVPHYENALDKQIAATALIYDLTLVTRNTKDFKNTGVRLLNPFLSF